MPAITNIRRTARDAARCSIYVDGEFFAACSIDVAAQLGLRKGLELTEELEKRLRSDERNMSLRARAYRFAMYKPRTERQVMDFLTRKYQATPEESEIVLEWLKSFNVIDDMLFVQRFLEAARQLKPMSKIASRQKLLAKGIPPLTVDAALESAYSTEDEITSAIKVAEKKIRMLAHHADAEQRLIRFLGGRGFSWTVIQQVMQRMKNELAVFVVVLLCAFQMSDAQTLSCVRVRLSETINRYQPVTQPVLSPDGRLFVDRKLHPDNDGGANDADDVWYSKRLDDGNWDVLSHEAFTAFTRPDVLFNFTGSGLAALVAGEYKTEGTEKKRCFAIISRHSSNSLFVRAAPLHIPGINDLHGNFYGFISEDLNTLLIAVELPGGKGDLDLYVSTNCKNVWSKPTSLGETINTNAFEGAPYLSPDGQTLYFASSGREDRRGKTDLYMSRRLNNTWTSWSKPQNLGLCVNTIEDETSISLIGRGDSAYITSWDAESGRTGIYLVGLPDHCKSTPWCSYKNVLADAITGAQINRGEMTIEPESGNASCGEWKVFIDSASGQFVVNLPMHTRNIIRTSSPGYVTHKQTIGIKTIDSTVDLRLTTQLFPRNTPLLSVYFERGISELSAEQLERLRTMIATYDIRNIAFEVTGYTDKIGTVPFNQTLSAQRAETIKRLLIENGLGADRITAVGRGIEIPMIFTPLSENPQSRRVDIFAAEPQ